MLAKTAVGLAPLTFVARCGNQRAPTADAIKVKVSSESSQVRSDRSTLLYSCQPLPKLSTNTALLGSGRFTTDEDGDTPMRHYAKTWPERT